MNSGHPNLRNSQQSTREALARPEALDHLNGGSRPPSAPDAGVFATPWFPAQPVPSTRPELPAASYPTDGWTIPPGPARYEAPLVPDDFDGSPGGDSLGHLVMTLAMAVLGTGLGIAGAFLG